MNETLPNASIAGAGVIGGGTYHTVKCSGSAKVTGDLDCVFFSCAGSLKAEGNLTCHEEMKISGAFKSEGALSGNTVRMSGAMKLQGPLQAKDIRISGALKAEADCSAESFSLCGGVRINGLLNAETVTITIDAHNGDNDSSSIQSIGGGTVTVKGDKGHRFRRFFTRKDHCLDCELIEADRVDLEYTVAQTVRACDAIIGAGCRIKVLEYSGTLQVDDSAKIGKTVKTG